MRVLFDQSTPVRLAKFLTGHEVKTAYQQGWSTLSNGDLLRAAEAAGFDIFITADQNIAYQQNLSGRRIAIIVIGKNRWSLVSTAIDRIVAAVTNAHAGSFERIEISIR